MDGIPQSLACGQRLEGSAGASHPPLAFDDAEARDCWLLFSSTSCVACLIPQLSFLHSSHCMTAERIQGIGGIAGMGMGMGMGALSLGRTLAPNASCSLLWECCGRETTKWQIRDAEKGRSVQVLNVTC
jgi:hypothetical protein